MMDLSAYKKISIGGVALKKLALDGVQVWKSGPTNLVPLSINADGTIYNGTGYKDGYRVRSGGAEGAVSNTSCTGFIKVSPGDVVRISGCMFSHSGNSNAINVSDNTFANIGQFTMFPAQYGIFNDKYTAYSSGSVVEEKTGVWKWVVPPASSGVEYIRVSGYDNKNGYPGARMIITINEEIT